MSAANAYGVLYAKGTDALQVSAVVQGTFYKVPWIRSGANFNTTPSTATSDITIAEDGPYHISAFLSLVGGSAHPTVQVAVAINGTIDPDSPRQPVVDRRAERIHLDHEASLYRRRRGRPHFDPVRREQSSAECPHRQLLHLRSRRRTGGPHRASRRHWTVRWASWSHRTPGSYWAARRNRTSERHRPARPDGSAGSQGLRLSEACRAAVYSSAGRSRRSASCTPTSWSPTTTAPKQACSSFYP